MGASWVARTELARGHRTVRKVLMMAWRSVDWTGDWRQETVSIYQGVLVQIVTNNSGAFTNVACITNQSVQKRSLTQWRAVLMSSPNACTNQRMY